MNSPTNLDRNARQASNAAAACGPESGMVNIVP